MHKGMTLNYYFQSSFWRTSKILCSPTSKRTRRMFWYNLTSEIYFNATRPLAPIHVKIYFDDQPVAPVAQR